MNIWESMSGHQIIEMLKEYLSNKLTEKTEQKVVTCTQGELEIVIRNVISEGGWLFKEVIKTDGAFPEGRECVLIFERTVTR